MTDGWVRVEDAVNETQIDFYPHFRHPPIANPFLLAKKPLSLF